MDGDAVDVRRQRRSVQTEERGIRDEDGRACRSLQAESPGPGRSAAE
jgi:hypothetical protein